MEENVTLLWDYYKKYHNKKFLTKLISYYRPFLKKVINKIYYKLPNTIDISDIESFANIGIIDAIEKFDHKRGIKFETYANIRVRGAIMDGIRKMDWLPRTLRSKMKKQEKEENETGAKKNNYKKYVLMSLDDPDFKDKNNYNKNKFQNVEEENLLINTPDFVDEVDDKIILRKAVSLLNKKERRVIYLYYFKGRTFKEIGQVMHITESRVSQIHKKTLKKLKKSLGSTFNFSLGLFIVSIISIATILSSICI